MAQHVAPELDTARLTMRAHRLDDFADLAAMWLDPEVTRHISAQSQTEEDVWARLLRYAGHWSLLGFGYWAVRERATGRFVGDVGFANLRRTLTPSLGDAPEAGWVLAHWAHGHGFATEAVTAALAWAATNFDRPTVCIIDPDNAASIRVAEKCGYRFVTRASYRGEPVLSYERP
jgi:RimJ/RimL family protein N-acetyltransferase